MKRVRLLDWLRGYHWTCECIEYQAMNRTPQIKFVVNHTTRDVTHRFARYVDVPDPVAVMVEEIHAAAPDCHLLLSTKSLRRLRTVLEEAYASVSAGS